MPIRLSFDDGPHESGTPRASEVLADHGVKATFFVWGEQAVEHRDIVRDILRAGHSVQPHCWEHRSHLDMTATEIAADIDRVLSLLAELGAPTPHLWRPPWGHVQTGVTRELARNRRLELVGWTIDSTDHAGTSAAAMYGLVTDAIASSKTNEAVVLMHDGCLEPGQLAKRNDVNETIELVRLPLADDHALPLSIEVSAQASASRARGHDKSAIRPRSDCQAKK
jgi:peptidoglycan/xylan/chitin deacetylase (PgdA/CDA1 family)